MLCNAAASDEARESVESLEKGLEGLREEIDDLKKVTDFTHWLLHLLLRESFAFATNAV